MAQTQTYGCRLDHLLYVEGMRDYRRIYAAGKQSMTLQTFGELEQLDKIDSDDRQPSLANGLPGRGR